MESQLQILSESLDKKLALLEEIKAYNEKQEMSFREGHPDLSSFDEAAVKKDELIERLEKLDEGFELLYGKLSEELKGNRERYAAQIRVLQDKIRRVTDMGMTIQAQEARNKKLIEDYFAGERENIRRSRKGAKAAYDYYRSMSGAGMPGSQFMDSKK